MVPLVLECRKLCQKDKHKSISNISFSLEAGVLLVLFGSYVVDKTSVLRLIAGLERPDSGEIYLDGELVVGPGVFVPPQRRLVEMVFREREQFPSHLTVEEYLTHAGPHRPNRIQELIRRFNLDGLENRSIWQLAITQRERLALARALIREPKVLLVNDFSLAFNSHEVYGEMLRRVIKQEDISVILATRDRDIALSMADQLALIHGGRIYQIGTPRELYNSPAYDTVALYLGDANILEQGQAHGHTVTTFLGELPLRMSCHGQVTVAIYPHNLTAEQTQTGNARVEACHYYGDHQVLGVRLNDKWETRLKIRVKPDEIFEEGEIVNVSVCGSVFAFP